MNDQKVQIKNCVSLVSRI